MGGGSGSISQEVCSQDGHSWLLRPPCLPDRRKPTQQELCLVTEAAAMEGDDSGRVCPGPERETSDKGPPLFLVLPTSCALYRENGVFTAEVQIRFPLFQVENS